MAFDPDKYLEKKEGTSGFDPDAYLKSKGEQIPAEEPSGLSKYLPYLTPLNTIGGEVTKGDPLENIKQVGKNIVGLGFRKPAFAGGEAASSYLADVLSGEGSKGSEHYKQIYLDALKQEQAEKEQFKEAHPVLATGSEIAGAALPFVATGGASSVPAGIGESALDALLYGSAQTLAEHPRSLLEGAEAQKEIVGDVAAAAPLNLALGAGFGLAGKTLGRGATEAAQAESGAIKPVSDIPIISQAKEAFEAGKMGQGFGESGEVLAREVGKKKGAVKEVANYFQNVENQLKTQKSNLLKDASEAGISVSSSSELPMLAGKLEEFSKEVPSKLYNEIKESLSLYNSEGLSPQSADSLRNSLYDVINKTQNPELKQAASDLRLEIAKNLEKDVPGYKEVNSLISQFLESGKKKFFPGGRLPGNKEVQSAKLGNKIEGLLENLRSRRPGSEDAQAIVSELESGIGGFIQKNPEAAEKLGINNVQDLINLIKKRSDEIVASQKMRGLSPTSGAPLLPSGIKQFIPGEEAALKAANIAGKATRVIGKSAERVGEVLNHIPGNTDTKKAATLFSLLQQNASLRKKMGFSGDENER